jgi:chemotaxis protein MotB
MSKNPNDDKQNIIIKRVKKVDGGHHGGAWKVAYADFVTAMMAFFLLLWLLSVTTDEQKAQISAYFAPADPRIAQTTSGSGGVMGGTTMSSEGAMTETQTAAVNPRDPAEGVGKEDGEQSDKKSEADEKAEQQEMDRQDKKSFAETEEKIRQAIEQSPELKEVAQSLLIDQTPEGLRIQIVDQEGKPMFEVGSAKPLPVTEKLLAMITQAVSNLPNKLSIRGHTDSKPYGTGALYTNWELSSDRANASRRVMLGAGLDIARIENVQGKADREPLLANDPANPRNRRISIILLKQSLVAGLKKPVNPKPSSSGKSSAPPEPKKKEEGVIYFP